MKKIINSLQINILTRHFGPLLFCFFTIMFLLLMQFLMNHIDKLVGKGIPFGVIVELILTNLAYMVVLAMPMAVLVAALMAFGKFSELREYAALKAAGVNPIKVIAPVIMAGAFLTIFLMWFSDRVLPDANQQARSLFIDIRLKEPGFDLDPNVFYNGIEGYIFLVKDIDSETDSLYDVTLFQEKTRDKNQAIIKANKGVLESNSDQVITLFLYEGTITQYLGTTNRDNNQIEETEFGKYRISFDLSEMAFSRSESDKRRRNDRTMTSRAMLAVVDTLKNEVQERKLSSSKFMQRIIPDLRTTDLAEPSKSEQQDEDSINAGMMLSAPFPAVKSEEPKSSPNNRFPDSLVVLNTFDEEAPSTILVRAQSGLRSLKSNYQNLLVKIQWKQKRIAQYMVEVHKKFSIPFACIIFVLIGAPLGLVTKNGNIGFSAIISALLLTFYWVSIIQGEKLADRLVISPAMGMWFGNALLGIIGILLLTNICTPFRMYPKWD